MTVHAPSLLDVSAGWGIVEADSIVVGLVVAAVAVFALVYVITRIRSGDQGGKGGKR